jgi:CBS domain-containing protein
VWRLARAGIDSGVVEIREVMTQTVVTCDPASSVQDVAALMRERNVGSVVLVRDGQPVGVVTDRDLAVSVLADGRSATDHAIDHASAPVVAGEPGMDVEAAAELMVRHRIRRLPIVDDGRLTGIVTLDDLAVRTGDVELVARLTTQITRAALPDFYFHHRGG